MGEASAFFRSRPGLDAPDLQLIFAPVYFVEHGFVRPPGHGFSIGYILLRPESRGRIRLRTPDPLDAPLIDANYLAHDEDRRTMIAGLKTCRALARTRALGPYRGPDYYQPGGDGEAALDAIVRQHSHTVYHPVGSCAMGAGPEAVVDARLRVHGLEGLRIADASIMPTIPGGNTHAATIMIAEKCAALMRGAARAGFPG